MLMRVTDENQTIADAQISISQEEEMDKIICDKSDVTYHQKPNVCILAHFLLHMWAILAL